MPIQCMQGAVCFIDVALIVVASLLAGQALGHHEGQLQALRLDRIGIVSSALFAVIAQLVGAYELQAHLSAGRSVLRAMNAWAGVTLFVLGLSAALLGRMPLAAGDIYIWSIACGSALALGRIGMSTAMTGLRRRGVFDQRSAVIGTGEQVSELVRYITQHKLLTLSLTGFYCDDEAEPLDFQTTPQGGALPYRGNLNALLVAIRLGAIDRVIIALPQGQESRARAIVARLSDTPVEIRLAPAGGGFSWTQNAVTVLGEWPVLTLLDWPLSRGQRLLKATEDRLLSLMALILLAPLMMIVAIAIKLDSPGPVLFRQKRQGYNCRDFEILKFRTMQVADEADAVIQARRNDPRVTAVGAILRRTSLDELPQLLNVLLGHMSMVGPRPHAVSTRAAGRLFGEISQSYPARHNVKPGMTGWAQVCGWRGETHSEEQLLRRLEHDLYYVRNWSIWFDLRILAQTVVTVLRQQNAY
ncbi:MULTISPECIES: undecaprenyl-phosphate glucose phosphotransferase [unclassified Novosphingobium]|uniref:undecaprenyl-phosphate glucose phosphotransferase n=1 Tax=unclassified Novosphingobium TaxID=2644732 RepID=UPI00135BD24A|nr:MULTISPECIES: undecaprenyl-phosphate glucose phosphotransferase [unclassified Novosphingobium]